MSGARNTARLPLVAAHTGHKSNHVRADDAPSLRVIGAAPGVEPLAGLGRTLHPGLALGPIYGSAACLNLSVRDREFGDQVPDGCAEALPVVGVVFHPSRMEQAHGTNIEVDPCQKDRRTKRV